MAKRAPASSPGMGQHSPLYIWMWDHYDRLTKMFTPHGPTWWRVAEMCRAEGLRDGRGNPPSAQTCRQTYWKIKRRKAEASVFVWPEPPPIKPGDRVVMTSDTLERVRKQLDKRSGRK